MASKITIKRSLTAAAPAGLSFGEMAFVQGSGLTANQLYVGISGGNPAWVGAQIGTTGTWTDNAAKTTLATQDAIEQRITSKITASTTGVSSFNGVTGAVTGVSSFNGLTGAVSGVTTSVANTFTALQTFSAGISASGGTFASDIKVNSLTVGRGGGGIDSNVALGPNALASNTTGNGNVGVGESALLSNTTGSSNIGVGFQALATNTEGTYNVGVGDSALRDNTEGNFNVGVGQSALVSNTTGDSNVGVGNSALASNTTGDANVGVGQSALNSNSTGNNNVGVGQSALNDNTTGANKTALGYGAGRYRGTGTDTNTTGTGGIYIGYQARGSTLAQTNEIVIGVDALGLGSHTAVIGATLQSAATIYGLLNLPSGLSTTGATFTGNISAPNIVSSFNGVTGAVTGVASFNGLTGAVSGVTTSVANTFSVLQTFSAGISSNGGTFGTPTQLVGTNITGTASGLIAGTVTTNANLTGAITSVGNGTTLGSFTSSQLATALSTKTGTGLNVFDTSPTLTTPKIAQINDTNGLAVLKTAATPSAVNEVTITNNITAQAPHISVTGSDANISLHLAPKGTGKYVVVENGTDGTKQIAFGVAGANTGTTTYFNAAQTLDRTITLPDATGTVALTANKLSVFAATTSSELLGVISDETGTGALVFANTPTLVTPNIGAATGTSLVLSGDLTVNGTTTTLNSTTLTIDDKNIELGSVAVPDNISAADGGITLKGATDKTLKWLNSGAFAWTSSENFDLVSTKAYYIAGASVLNATTLGTLVVNSSLTSVGILTSLTVSGTLEAGLIDGGTF